MADEALYYGTGRRKNAVARVRLVPGTGKVTIYNEMAKREMEVRIVTTLRQNALKGLVSKESPVGKALLGRRVGERAEVSVSPEVKYFVEIRRIEKGEDDESLEISAY